VQKVLSGGFHPLESSNAFVRIGRQVLDYYFGNRTLEITISLTYKLILKVAN